MADFTLDEFGRVIKDLPKMIKDMLMQATGKETKVKDEDDERNKYLEEIEELLKNLDKNFENYMKDDKKRAENAAKGTKPVKADVEAEVEVTIDGGSPENAGKKDGKRYGRTFKQQAVREMAGVASSVAGLLGGGEDIYTTMTKGIFADQITFEQNIRKIRFETEGLTSETGAASGEWSKLDKVAATTGMHLADFQKVYVKNLKKGISSQKESVKVLKAGGNLSTMIGSDVEQTTDLFHDWHMQLGLSGNQMAQVARNTQDVAKQTGVTGDALLDAVKKSEQFMKNMRNAGTLTASATKQIMLMVAESEKLGIGDQMTRVLDAATSSSKLFFEASKETQALLFAAAESVGRSQSLIEGTLMSTRGGQKDFAAGLENILGDFGYQFEDLANLPADELANLNMQLSQAYGVQIGELERMHEAAETAGKSLSENLGSLDKELENTNLTTEKRLELEKKQRDMLMSTGFAFMTKFDEQMGKAGLDFQQAAEEAAAKMTPDELDDIATIGEKLGIDTSTAIGKMEASYMLGAKTLSEAGGPDFTARLQEAIAGGDQIGIQEVLAEMNAEQQKLGVEEKAKLDPISQVAQWTKESNEYLAEISSTLMWGFIQSLGASGAILAQLIALGISFATSIAGGGLGSGIIGTLMGKGDEEMGGGGAGGLAERAAEAAGAGGGGEGGDESASLVETIQEQIDELKGLDIKTSDLKDIGKQLAKLAVGMAILVAGAAALATTIILMGKAVLGITGVDAGEAIKIAYTLAAILGAAAVIAAMAYVAAKALEKVGDNFDEIVKAVPTMLKGALALGIMIGVVMLLAAAIIGMGAILSYFVSPEWAASIANAVASILLSAAAIAGAVLLAAGALAVLGLLASGPQAAAVAAYAGLGAIALLALTPAIMLLAGAIIGMGALLSSIVDPEWAAGVAENVATILWSAAKIAGSVLLAAGALALLGVGLPFIFFAIPLMMMGAVALQVLTPAIASIAASVIALADEVMASLGMDPDRAASVAGSVASILWSAAKIAGSVLLMAGFLSILGAGLPFIFFTIPLLYAGAAALMILTPAIAFIAESIIGLAQAVMATIGVSPDEAAETAQAVGDILAAAGNIAWSVLEQVPMLTALGAMLIAAPFIATMMAAGAIALGILGTSVVLYVAAVNLLSNLLVAAATGANFEGAIEVFDKIERFAVAISESWTKTKEALAPMLERSWFGFGDTDLENTMEDLGDALTGMMYAMITEFPEDGLIAAATMKADAMVTLMETLASVIEKIAEVAEELKSGGMESLGENIGVVNSAMAEMQNLGAFESGKAKEASWLDTIGGGIAGALIGAGAGFMAGGPAGMMVGGVHGAIGGAATAGGGGRRGGRMNRPEGMTKAMKPEGPAMTQVEEWSKMINEFFAKLSEILFAGDTANKAMMTAERSQVQGERLTERTTEALYDKGTIESTEMQEKSAIRAERYVSKRMRIASAYNRDTVQAIRDSLSESAYQAEESARDTKRPKKGGFFGGIMSAMGFGPKPEPEPTRTGTVEDFENTLKHFASKNINIKKEHGETLETASRSKLIQSKLAMMTEKFGEDSVKAFKENLLQTGKTNIFKELFGTEELRKLVETIDVSDLTAPSGPELAAMLTTMDLNNNGGVAGQAAWEARRQQALMERTGGLGMGAGGPGRPTVPGVAGAIAAHQTDVQDLIERERATEKQTQGEAASVSKLESIEEEKKRIQEEMRELLAELVRLTKEEETESVGKSPEQQLGSTSIKNKPLGARLTGEIQSSKYANAGQQFINTGLV